MTKFDMNDVLGNAEKEWGMGSGEKGQWYKIAEGVNKVRILSVLEPFASHFKIGACIGKEQCPECKKMVKYTKKDGTEDERPNNPMVKFLCHVLDYKDNQIKLAQFPYSIAKSIQTLQNDPDWAFSEAPMPYDLKINAEGAGSKEVTYNVVAVPQEKSVPLTKETLEKLSKMHTADQVKEAMQKKREKELGLSTKEVANDTKVPYPTETINPEDIGF